MRKPTDESTDSSAKSLRSTLASHVYYGLRNFVHKKRWLLRGSQIVRGCWMYGPFRQHLIRYYQQRKANRPLVIDKRDLFPQLEIHPVVSKLIENGYAEGVTVPTEYLDQIVEYCENTGLKIYWNPHKECEAIDHIARNWKIVEIARQYLGIEPILWATQLKWSFGDGKQTPLGSRYVEPPEYDGHAFHFDRFDFKSLTLFIYLTDVDPSAGPHVVIEGTHAHKSVWELCHNILRDEAAQQKFGNRIKSILGPKGTMFFEETSSYHKASRGKTERLILSIHFVLQRRPPPERPTLPAAA
jgi:hypothetical protein